MFAFTPPSSSLSSSVLLCRELLDETDDTEEAEETELMEDVWTELDEESSRSSRKGMPCA